MNQVKTVEHREWLKHVQEWESSGLSQAAYCKEHRLPFSTFKKKLQKYSHPTYFLTRHFTQQVAFTWFHNRRSGSTLILKIYFFKLNMGTYFLIF